MRLPPLSACLILVGLCACQPCGPETCPSPPEDSPVDSPVDSAEDSETAETGGRDSAGPSPRLELGAEQACAEPVAAVAYDEVGASMGLTGAEDADGHQGAAGGAVVVEDLDGDGDLDVVTAFYREWPVLHRRDGDSFVPESLPQPSERDPYPTTLGLADLDGDGQLDLLLSGGSPGAWRGGDLALMDFPTWSTPAFEPTPDSGGTLLQELVPHDIDGDGLVDVMVVMARHQDGGPGEPEQMVDYVAWGTGPGGWQVDEQALGVQAGGRMGFDAMFFDRDGDADPDLYVANDMLTGDVLYDNVDGVLTPVSADLGCSPSHLGMGADVGDYDRDGLPDLFVTAGVPNSLLRGLEDGSCVDTHASTGLAELQAGMAWGAQWLDFDNDGHLDLLVAQGEMAVADDEPEPRPIGLYRQVEGRFVDAGLLGGEGVFRSVVAADHNGDGLLDPLVTDVRGAPLLFLSRGCTAMSWLRVEAPPASRVEVEANGQTWTAWTRAATGFGGAGPSQAHLGLGEATQVDRLRVVLPGGAVLESEAAFSPRRVVRVSQ